jgi:hypothetical protein
MYVNEPIGSMNQMYVVGGWGVMNILMDSLYVPHHILTLSLIQMLHKIIYRIISNTISEAKSNMMFLGEVQNGVDIAPVSLIE